MQVKELHEALGRMIEDGHGEAKVMHVNGQGKATQILGWELSLVGAYEPARGAAQKPVGKQLKFYTTSRF